MDKGASPPSDPNSSGTTSPPPTSDPCDAKKKSSTNITSLDHSISLPNSSPSDTTVTPSPPQLSTHGGMADMEVDKANIDPGELKLQMQDLVRRVDRLFEGSQGSGREEIERLRKVLRDLVNTYEYRLVETVKHKIDRVEEVLKAYRDGALPSEYTEIGIFSDGDYKGPLFLETECLRRDITIALGDLALYRKLECHSWAWVRVTADLREVLNNLKLTEYRSKALLWLRLHYLVLCFMESGMSSWFVGFLSHYRLQEMAERLPSVDSLVDMLRQTPNKLSSLKILGLLTRTVFRRYCSTDINDIELSNLLNFLVEKIVQLNELYVEDFTAANYEGDICKARSLVQRLDEIDQSIHAQYQLVFGPGFEEWFLILAPSIQHCPPYPY